MEKRSLGRSGLEITPVVFGAWAIGGWMWGGSDEQDAISAITASIDSGINMIDTAAIYGMGDSERIVAKAIKGRRDKVLIATKCGMRWGGTEGSDAWETVDNNGQKLVVHRYANPKSIIEECENSLKRLDLDVIDLYQIHWPDTTTPPESSMEAMVRLKEQGKIRAIGVSNYNVEWMSRAATVGQIDSLQPPFSLLRRDIEAEILPHCINNNIGVICYSPLERGLLTGAVSPSRQFAEGDHRAKHPYFTEERRKAVLEALEELQPICNAYKASPAQLIINWTIQQPGITAAIVGARNAAQATHNAAALNFTLKKDELEEIERAFKKHWK